MFCAAVGCPGSASPLCCSAVRQTARILGDLSHIRWPRPLPNRRELEGSSPCHVSHFSPGSGASSAPAGSSQRVGAGATARRHRFAFHSRAGVQQNEQVVNHAALIVSLVRAVFWHLLTPAKPPSEFLSGFCRLKAFAALAVALFDKDGKKKRFKPKFSNSQN